MKIAFIFPGQGSQYVGMGKELYDRFDYVKEIFNEANETLGYDLTDLCFNGPKEELNKTYRTQPAIIAVSRAVYRVLEEAGIQPSLVAGHSLGEYSALVAAGVLSYRDALILTEKRGAFMQEAVPEGKGMMAAILGLHREMVDKLCLNVSSGYVSTANYNSPGQVVIAGEREAVEEAQILSKEAGAKKAIPLAVSVPSHCTLMAEASERVSLFFKEIEFNEPTIPIVNNADAMLLSAVDSIKDSLIRQLNSPLLWEDSVKTMIEKGINTFIEAGPGRVLSGLIKRIDSKVTIFHVENNKSYDQTVEAIKKASD